MSGPSLKKHDAHSAIHEAALNEARELRDLLRHCLKQGDKEKATQVAEVIIEHWESRTLKHAQSEEEGLYKELVEQKPEYNDMVIELTRDHNLMRRAVEKIKGFLDLGEVDERMIRLIDGLIIIDVFHNEDEMEKLIPKVG